MLQIDRNHNRSHCSFQTSTTITQKTHLFIVLLMSHVGRPPNRHFLSCALVRTRWCAQFATTTHLQYLQKPFFFLQNHFIRHFRDLPTNFKKLAFATVCTPTRAAAVGSETTRPIASSRLDDLPARRPLPVRPPTLSSQTADAVSSSSTKSGLIGMPSPPLIDVCGRRAGFFRYDPFASATSVANGFLPRGMSHIIQ